MFNTFKKARKITVYKILGLGAVIILSLLFLFYNVSLFIVWLISLGLGFTLNRSGICFSSAYTDVILFKNFRIARALIITTTISLIGISFIQFIAISVSPNNIPGRFAPFGVHTIVGAFLFGLGMVLAGTCPTGTLQKMGEGFTLYFVVLVAIIAGSVLGAYHFRWWFKRFPNHPTVYLPNIFGWGKSLIISLLILCSLYLLTIFIEKRFFDYSKKGCKKCQIKG